MPKPDSSAAALATRNDIKGILGDIDPAEMLAIMALKPTIADIEAASVWLDGDPDVFGAGKAVQGVASEIVAILTENEEEEEPRALARWALSGQARSSQAVTIPLRVRV